MIGGGFIGLEIAAAARRLGADVTVIEAFPRLLTRGVPVEIARALKLWHWKEGVRFLFDAQVAANATDGVDLADGGFVPADLIVAEMTIAKRAHLQPASLADPAIRLKDPMRAATAEAADLIRI